MDGELAAIPAEYDRAVPSEYPGGVTGHGWDASDRFWLGLRAAFPSAEFTIHHRIGRDDPLMPPRAALLWSLTGKHDGWGAVGRPTGAKVHVMGASHAEFGALGPAPRIHPLRRNRDLETDPSAHTDDSRDTPGNRARGIPMTPQKWKPASFAMAISGPARPPSSTPTRRAATRRRTSPSSAAA